MQRLSSPISDLRPHYDVVVVGSGYGGAIAACRLARAGRSVCVLERGRELVPGDFPEDLLGAARETQAHVGDSVYGSRAGLFDFRLGRDISVLVGCGLGGTSLINANVALEADPRIFDDERWPTALARRRRARRRGLRRARRRCWGPCPTPPTAPPLQKLVPLRRSA